jgi:hypothetical protein
MTDKYDEIEARIVTLIQGLARFAGHTERVTRGNYRILDTGIDEAVVIEGGTFGPETAEGFGFYRDFDVLVNIFTRYTDEEAETYAAFRSLRSDALDIEEKYPSLNHLGGVIQTIMQSDGDPADVYDKTGAGPFFKMQVLRWTITRRYSVSGGEY